MILEKVNDNFQMEIVEKYNRKIWWFNNEKF